jgi:hypothetical protein
LALSTVGSDLFSGGNETPGDPMAMVTDDQHESAGPDVLLPDDTYSRFAGVNISVVIDRVYKFAP